MLKKSILISVLMVFAIKIIIKNSSSIDGVYVIPSSTCEELKSYLHHFKNICPDTLIIHDGIVKSTNFGEGRVIVNKGLFSDDLQFIKNSDYVSGIFVHKNLELISPILEPKQIVFFNIDFLFYYEEIAVEE